MKVSKRPSGNNNGVNLTLMVDKAWIDKETLVHHALGKTASGKPLIVTMAPKEVKGDDGKTIKFGFCKSQNHKHQFVDENGDVQTTQGTMKLDKGGILTVARGEWGAKIDGVTNAVIGPNSHVKVRFYNDQDVREKGYPSDVISTSVSANGEHGNVNMFGENSLVDFDSLPNVITSSVNAYLENVENLRPVVVAIPVNDSGEICGDEEIFYVQTWDKEEKRPTTAEESLTLFGDKLGAELDTENQPYLFVVGHTIQTNQSNKPQDNRELATNRTLKVVVDGEDMNARVNYARPGIAKIKFSAVEQDDGSFAHFNSVNTIAYTGGSKLLIEELARVNELSINPEFKEANDAVLEDAKKQNSEIRKAEYAAKRDVSKVDESSAEAEQSTAHEPRQ